MGMERLTDRTILLAGALPGMFLAWFGVEEDALVVALAVGVAVVLLLLLWPNSSANLTSFQMPTEELTKNVETKVVVPAMAWSIWGKTRLKIVSDTFTVANVAAYRDQTSRLGRDVKNVAG